MLIGFSVDLKSLQSDGEHKILGEMLAAGCGAIQIHAHAGDNPIHLNALDLVKKFDYRTIHIPKFYSRKEAKRAVDSSKRLAKLIDAQDLTMHPNGMDSFAWLTSEFDGNLNIENMDWRKDFGQTAEDLERVFAQLPDAGWTFDVNHVKTNDPSMKLADELYKNLSPHLRQYHLSGFGGEDLPHTLLADTRQDDIIAKVTDLSKPIILESLGPEDIGRFREELDYVLARL